jgi:hypothetical protein
MNGHAMTTPAIRDLSSWGKEFRRHPVDLPERAEGGGIVGRGHAQLGIVIRPGASDGGGGDSPSRHFIVLGRMCSASALAAIENPAGREDIQGGVVGRYVHGLADAALPITGFPPVVRWP